MTGEQTVDAPRGTLDGRRGLSHSHATDATVKRRTDARKATTTLRADRARTVGVEELSAGESPSLGPVFARHRALARKLDSAGRARVRPQREFALLMRSPTLLYACSNRPCRLIRKRMRQDGSSTTANAVYRSAAASFNAARLDSAMAVSVGFFSGFVVKQLMSVTMTFGASWMRL